MRPDTRPGCHFAHFGSPLSASRLPQSAMSAPMASATAGIPEGLAALDIDTIRFAPKQSPPPAA